MTELGGRWQALQLDDDLVLADRFAIERVLCVGAGTLVLAARQLPSGRLCSLTVLRPELGAQSHAADMFVAQAERLAKVTAEQVVGVVEVSRLPNGLPFAVSDELPHQTLRDVLWLLGPLPVPLAVSHVLAVCEGLGAAHLHGVPHGHVCVERAYLAHRDGATQLRLADFGFGLARVAAPETALADGVMELALTAQHLAPEQLAGTVAADVRCDVWGVGLMLYELLAGSNPFAGPSFAAVASRVGELAPPPLGSVRQDVPPQLSELVSECLAKKPERRIPRLVPVVSALRLIDIELGQRRANGDPARRMPPREEPARLPLRPPAPERAAPRGRPEARAVEPEVGERVILSRLALVPRTEPAPPHPKGGGPAPRAWADAPFDETDAEPDVTAPLPHTAVGGADDRSDERIAAGAEARSADLESVSAPPASPRLEAVAFGRYLLGRKLGVGRHAEVFLARPAEGHSPAPELVIKRPYGAAEFDLERLRLEVVRTHAAPHANLAQIYELGLVEGTPYLAMEYVAGVDGRRLMRFAEDQGQGLPPSVALYIARALAAGLGALHTASDARGAPLALVHGSVAPSSVYLSLDGDVKLANRSLVTRVAGRDPRQAYKFEYQAPEELACESIDHRADLFALGVLCAEMLIGERLFPGKGVDVLRAIQAADIAPLRRKAASLPDGVFEVCLKALARRPGDRFQSAADFERALAHCERRGLGAAANALRDWVHSARDFVAADSDRAPVSLAPAERTAAISLAAELAHARSQPPPSEPVPLRVRRATDGSMFEVSYSDLVERIATGELGLDDETSLRSDELRPIRAVPELSRHAVAFTPEAGKNTLNHVFPEHTYALGRSSMLQVLGEMRQAGATALLLAETNGGAPRRKEIYLRNGKLHAAHSSERDELLGEYLVRFGKIDRAELDMALAVLPSFDGRIGDALIGLGLVEALDVFRAIRDQGRDRLAALFAWREGRVRVYLGRRPTSTAFDLDLDLTFPMMAGALIATGNEPETLLPMKSASCEPGPRAPNVAVDADELAVVHPAVREVAAQVAGARTLGELVSRCERAGLPYAEACAALATARALRWVTLGDDVRKGR